MWEKYACVCACVRAGVCVRVRVCVSCHRTVQLNEHKPTGLTCAINGAITVRRKSRIMETKLLDYDGGHLAAAFPGWYLHPLTYRYMILLLIVI